MNQRKVEMREHRLSLLQAQFEVRTKMLEEKGLDEKIIKKDPTMRRLKAKAQQVKRAIDSLKGEPPKEEKAEKGKKAKKPKKPEKKAAQPKDPKPPKEKKPKPEAEAPPEAKTPPEAETPPD
jgi:hypothetical protein